MGPPWNMKPAGHWLWPSHSQDSRKQGLDALGLWPRHRLGEGYTGVTQTVFIFCTGTLARLLHQLPQGPCEEGPQDQRCPEGLRCWAQAWKGMHPSRSGGSPGTNGAT